MNPFCYVVGLLGMTQLTRNLPIALRLILRGFPLEEDMKQTFSSIFGLHLSEPRKEINLCCKWDWNPGPFDLQSSTLTNRPPSTPILDGWLSACEYYCYYKVGRTCYIHVNIMSLKLQTYISLWLCVANLKNTFSTNCTDMYFYSRNQQNSLIWGLQ